MALQIIDEERGELITLPDASPGRITECFSIEPLLAAGRDFGYECEDEIVGRIDAEALLVWAFRQLTTTQARAFRLFLAGESLVATARADGFSAGYYHSVLRTAFEKMRKRAAQQGIAH